MSRAGIFCRLSIFYVYIHMMHTQFAAEVADSILNTIDEQVLVSLCTCTRVQCIHVYAVMHKLQAILELTRLVPEAVQGVTSTVQALCPMG